MQAVVEARHVLANSRRGLRSAKWAPKRPSALPPVVLGSRENHANRVQLNPGGWWNILSGGCPEDSTLLPQTPPRCATQPQTAIPIQRDWYLPCRSIEARAFGVTADELGCFS